MGRGTASGPLSRNASRAKVRKRTTAHASTAALQEQVAALTQDGLPKTDNSDTAIADNFPWYLEIALSGGGHRATAYALGALLYLVHAKLNRKVRNIASVSGASITNAFIASRCDFQSVEIDKFKPIAAELISKLERRGLFSVWTTWLCVAAVVALMIAVSCLFVWIWWGFVSNSPFLDMWGGFMIFSIVLSIALAFRGWIIDRWMAAVYFGPRRTAPRLKDISGRAVDHVFCATDLCSGLPFFFSSFFGGRQISTFYGRAEAPFVPLQQVVRASSAFPPAIPAIRYFPFHEFLRENDTSGKFEYEPGPPVIWLTDGGAYNNFGTEWHVVRKHVFQFDHEYAQKKYADSADISKEFTASARRNVALLSRVGYGDIQLIVDASQPERWQHIADLGLKVVELIREPLINLRIMAHCAFDSRATVWTGS